MVELTFYGGVNEIGGNKTLLRDGDTKVFLDFGMSFGRKGQFFEEYMQPRTANAIGDFLCMQLVPDIEGAYREDIMRHCGLKCSGPDIDAVFLSHAHADHASYVSFLHEDIPIYCGQTAHRILEAIDESSQRGIETEVLNFKERPIINTRADPINRTFNTFRTGDRLKVGSIEIEPIHVDHSVPGAYGFVIHTSEGSVVYTGDLRLHGTHSEMTEDFIEKAMEETPVAMITEGTNIDKPKSDESEAKVYQESLVAVRNTKNLAIVDFNFKDVDRFRTFLQIAQDTDRTLAISFKNACFLDKYSEDKKLNIPDSSTDGIVLYKDKKGKGLYEEKDYAMWERKYLNNTNLVTAEDIERNQGNYLMIMNFWSFQRLVDIQPENGSLFVHSLSEAFNEEMAISQQRVDNWLNHFGLRKVQSHCSGHASGPELKEIIERIKPKTLFPIHTEKPEIFQGVCVTTQIVEEGKEYRI